MDEDGFVRQRRNIILVSIVLVFADALGFKFNEINIVGNKVVLDHAVRVTPFLWVIWLYLLLRYWQAFQEYGGKKFIEFIKDDIGARLTTYALEQARRAVVAVPNVQTNEKGPIVLMQAAPWEGLSASAEVQYMVGAGQNSSVEQTNVAISKLRMLSFYFAASAGGTFNRSIVSEPYLPFAIAAAPVVHLIYSHLR